MAEAEVSIPTVVDKNEIIDRIVYEPSFFCEGRLAPSAFALVKVGKSEETYISVFRNNYYNFADIVLPSPRIQGDSVAGIAQLRVNEVQAISSPKPTNELSLAVKAKSTKRYPFHAGIFTTIDGVPINSGNGHTNPLFMYVQKELVHISKYHSKEELLPEEALAESVE